MLLRRMDYNMDRSNNSIFVGLILKSLA